jgi:hypothetical protein
MHTQASACVLFARSTHSMRILPHFLMILLAYRLGSRPRALSLILSGYTIRSMPMALRWSKSFVGKNSVCHSDVYSEGERPDCVSIARLFHRKCQGFSEVMSNLSYVYQLLRNTLVGLILCQAPPRLSVVRHFVTRFLANFRLISLEWMRAYPPSKFLFL